MVTFPGTAVGLAWSEETAGVIRSDGLVAQIQCSQLLATDPGLPPLRADIADAARSGVRFYILCPPGKDHDTLRLLGEHTAQLNTRSVAYTCELSVRDGSAVDSLIEEIRITQDLVRAPVALDPALPSSQEPARLASVLREVCERAWCGFVLDLTTIHSYAQARGIDAEPVVADLPPDRVAFVRVRSSTEHPLTSSVRELVLNTMARWDEHAPALILESTRPVTAVLRELSELMTLTGHAPESDEFQRLDLALRATSSGVSDPSGKRLG